MNITKVFPTCEIHYNAKYTTAEQNASKRRLWMQFGMFCNYLWVPRANRKPSHTAKLPEDSSLSTPKQQQDFDKTLLPRLLALLLQKKKTSGKKKIKSNFHSSSLLC